MPTYRLSRSATDDLVAIFREGMKEFGLTQAEAYHDGLDRTFQFLASYPRAARLRPELSPPVRAFPYKAHLIVYDVDADDIVVILRVRHGREDWQQS